MFVRSQLQVHSIANVDVSTSFCIKFYQLSACRLLTMTMLSVANQLLFARAVVQCIIFDMIPLCLMCIHTCTYMTWSAVITAMSEMLNANINKRFYTVCTYDCQEHMACTGPARGICDIYTL